MAAILNGGQGCHTYFEKGPPKDQTIQVKLSLTWFSGFRGEGLQHTSDG